jgi:hypothetical protein
MAYHAIILYKDSNGWVMLLLAGDWLALGNYLAKGGRGGYYDIVLTAETIYNEESQIRLLECIKQVGSVFTPQEPP